MSIKIACLQMNSGAEVAANLTFINDQLRSAMRQGVEIVQLPENFAQMPKHASEQVVETPLKGKIQDFLIAKATEYQVTIIAGSLPVRVSPELEINPVARCVVVSSQGQLLANYDKIHLFDVDLPSGTSYRESDRYSSGATDKSNRVVVRLGAQTPIQVGLSICYDLRFPELYRELTLKGAELISVPSAFTFDTGKAHWETLLRARAIENQAYVFAAAQTGKHANGRMTWGHSMIIDPWGEILAQADDKPGLIMARVDPIEVQKLRKHFPTQSHRRLEN
jgi:nitrilase